jgi:hypothetical protein
MYIHVYILQEAIPSEAGTTDYDPQRQSSAAPSEATSYQRREQVEVKLV